MISKVDYIHNPSLLINQLNSDLKPVFNKSILVIIFGSLAKKNFLINSDIDLLVVSNELQKQDLDKCIEDYVEKGIGYDIVLMDEVKFNKSKNTLLVRSALKDGIVLWEKKKI